MRKANDTEKIIIKGNGKSYAELLKNVKHSVDLKRTGVKVNKVKQTRKGDLLLEVLGKTDANKLKEELKTNVKEIQLIHKSKETVMHLTDIEADVEEDELKEEILRNTAGMGTDDIMVTSIRPTKHGTQSATISVSQKWADHLDSIGKVRIGWTYCRIRKRVFIVRCFRCLQKERMHRG